MNNTKENNSLNLLLNDNPYQAYSYAYPHKSAYRLLEPAQDLKTVWSQESRDALFLYIHIPFCSMRCGFCNLFTFANPNDLLVEQYLKQLHLQIQKTADFLGDYQFARLSLGGGTPTFLNAFQLNDLFEHTQKYLKINPHQIPSCIEVSPETVNKEKLTVLNDAGFERISMGVQSFNADEIQNLARLQQNKTVNHAIDLIRQFDFQTLNLDLIYGIEGQTLESWLFSVDVALSYQPEEIYLYPLYIRPLTNLGKRTLNNQNTNKNIPIYPENQNPNQNKNTLSFYLSARDRLREAGYEQLSMRMFRAPHAKIKKESSIAYSCQDDGMIGLGCGARSYTRKLHYASEFAVSRGAVLDILRDYCDRPESSFDQAHYGFILNDNEQKRRFIIQSLLIQTGLNLNDYYHRFHSHALNDFPELNLLIDLNFAEFKKALHLFTLTNLGFAKSDSIGPWLISENIRQKMKDFELC